LQRLAPAAEEVGELVAPVLAVGLGAVVGGKLYYQDKSLSGTWIDSVAQ
jgi:hypothetical protein